MGSPARSVRREPARLPPAPPRAAASHAGDSHILRHGRTQPERQPLIRGRPQKNTDKHRQTQTNTERISAYRRRLRTLAGVSPPPAGRAVADNVDEMTASA